MRVLNKDWWDVVLLHFTYAEWKQLFRMTGHSFITLIHQEEQLVPCVIRHYAIFTSLHMRSTFQFWFSIWSSVYMSSRSDYKRNKTTPYDPIEILIRSGQFNPTDVFTCDFFIPIVLLVLLRSDCRVHVNAARDCMGFCPVKEVQTCTLQCKSLGSVRFFLIHFIQ